MRRQSRGSRLDFGGVFIGEDHRPFSTCDCCLFWQLWEEFEGMRSAESLLVPLLCAHLGLRGGPRGWCWFGWGGIKGAWACRSGWPHTCLWGSLTQEIKLDVGRKGVRLMTGAKLTEFEVLNLNLAFQFMKVGGWSIFYLALVSLSTTLNIWMYRAWTSICIPAQSLQEWACESWSQHELQRLFLWSVLSPLLLPASSAHRTPHSRSPGLTRRVLDFVPWDKSNLPIWASCAATTSPISWSTWFSTMLYPVSQFENMSRIAFRILMTTQGSQHCKVTELWMRAQPVSPYHSYIINFPEAEGDLASTHSVCKCSYLAHSLQKKHPVFKMLSPNQIVLLFQACFFVPTATHQPTM